MPQIEFEGKWNVYAAHLTTPFRPLKADKKRSVSPTEDGNLIIHGDNLHALKALLPAYGGRVNCIYIDPPYNTGNEGWCYNDNLNSPLMKRWLKENGAVDGEDEERHDKWLCMMWPRLHLLRDLLAEDGVIFISIDDNEVHRLRMMMDEIFGEDNFIANIIWQKKYAPANDAKYFSDNHDFVLVYAKNAANNGNSFADFWQRHLLPRTDKQNKLYKYNDNDGKGFWRTDNLTAKTYSEQYDYPIVNPNTGKKHHPAQGTCWRTGKATMKKWIAENRVFFGKNGKGAPQLKRYMNEVQQGIVPLTVWLHDEVGHTDSARKQLKTIFSDVKLPFDNPKPTKLIEKILRIGTDKDAIVLDSFAGSGTTAQAVMELNKEDGGKRKFILVECEDYADTITAERVRRVIKKLKTESNGALLKNGFGGNFNYCTLGKEISVEDILRGKNLPDYETLARCAMHNLTGIMPAAIKQGKDWFFAETDEYRMHLIYQPKVSFLKSQESALTLEYAQRVGKIAAAKRKKVLVFATHHFMSQKQLVKYRVIFCQLPYCAVSNHG